jgi:hypothetical protein
MRVNVLVRWYYLVVIYPHFQYLLPRFLTFIQLLNLNLDIVDMPRKLWLWGEYPILTVTVWLAFLTDQLTLESDVLSLITRLVLVHRRLLDWLILVGELRVYRHRLSASSLGFLLKVDKVLSRIGFLFGVLDTRCFVMQPGRSSAIFRIFLPFISILR